MKKLTLLLITLALCTLIFADTYIIGTGTSASGYSPFYGYYNYSWSKAIWTSAELTTAGVPAATPIIGIGFYVGNTTSNYTMLDQRIYVRNTALTSYGTATDETGTGYPDPTYFLNLFQGDITYNGSGWHYITFTTSPVWDGTSNLELLFENRDGAYVSGYPTFRYTSTSPNYMTVYKYQDASFPAVAGTRDYNRPNVAIITPSTTPPEAPVLSLPLDGATGVSITPTLSWTAPTSGAIPTGYKVYLGDSSTLTDVNIIANVTTLSYTIPSSYALQYSYTYYWTVSAYNENGDGPQATVRSFTTRADPTIYTFPYTAGDFETGALPLNWVASEGATGSSYHWTVTTSASHGPSAPHSGTYFGWLNCYNAYTTYNPYYLTTPPIALDATAKRLTYWYWIGTNTYDNPLFVEISTDNQATWTTLYTHSNASNTLAWYQNTISLEAYASHTVYLRFKGMSNYSSGMTDLGLDDIVIEDIPAVPIFSYSPTIIAFGTTFVNTPTAYQNVTVTNIGGGVLNLAESDVSIIGTDASMFNVNKENLPAELSAGQSVIIPVRYNPTATGNHTATLSMGYNSTNYDVTLSGNALGENALYESFEGSFPPVGWANPGSWSNSTSYAKHGRYSAYKYGSTSSQYILSTPKVTITDTSTLDFWALCSSTSGNLQIVYSSDRNTWYKLGSDITFAATYTWYHNVIDLSSLAGNNYYLGFRTAYSGYYYVDYVFGPDITAEAPGPVTLTSPANGATMVSTLPTFTWTAPTTGGVPTSYTVFCDTSTSPTTPIGTTRDLNFTPTTPLENDTQYYWTVKAENSAGSSTADPFSFTTIEQGYTIIGTGTSTQRQPFGTLFGYERSAALYTNAQIGGYGLLDKVAWNCAATTTTVVPYKIYAMQTTDAALTAMSWNTFIESATLVAEGNHTFSTPGWHLFELGDPFPYTADNLIVAVETNYGGSGGGSGHNFYYTTVATNSHQYWYKDNTPPTDNGYLNAQLPNIMLHLSELPTNPTISITPTSIDFGQVVQGIQVGPNYVKVTNIGGGILTLLPSAITIINDPDNNFSFDFENQVELAAGMSVNIPVYVTAHSEGTLTAKLRITYAVIDNDVDLSATGLPAGVVVIGTGTEDLGLPIDTYYKYSYSQSIFLQSDIHIANRYIDKISFYWYAEDDVVNSNNWIIYMGNTDLTEFSDANSWISIDQLTPVFSGPVNLSAGERWIEITLESPFYHTNQNLVIAVDENAPGYDYNWSYDYYFYGTSTGAKGYRSISYNDDFTNPDPNNPPTSGSSGIAGFPNIKMQFEEEQPPLPVELTTFTAVISSDNLVEISWITQTETGMVGYYVYRSNSESLEDAIAVSDMIEALNTPEQHTYKFLNSEIYDSGNYYYWLQTVEMGGTVNFHGPVSVYYTSAEDNPVPEIPKVTELRSIYPNPFNPVAYIPYSLAEESDTHFYIYNVKGQLLRHIYVGPQNPGYYQISWDGKDINGKSCGSGVYYIIMKAGKQTFQRKAVLMK